MFKEQVVCCEHDGHRIFGKLLRPDVGKKHVPLVIFSHELGMTHESGLPYARAIASRGWAAYVFDYAGGSLESRSDGSMLEMSAKTEASDLACVLETAKQWEFIQADQIVLMGGSLGGLVATMVAHDYRNGLAGLVLLYPAFQLPGELRNLFSDRRKIPATFTFANLFQLGRPFAEDVFELNPYQLMPHFRKDVLILYGDQDEAVPLPYIEKAVGTFPHAALHIIHGTGHFFPEPDKKTEAIDQILRYLSKRHILSD